MYLGDGQSPPARNLPGAKPLSQSPALAPPGSGSVGGVGWIAPLVKLWLPVLACLPLAGIFMMGLLNRPDYEFFPLHLGAVALLMYLRSQDLGEIRPNDKPLLNLLFWAWWLAVVACSVLALERVSFLLGICGLFLVTVRMGGRKLLLAWWPCALLLLWMVPPPFGLLDWLVQRLQGLAVRASHHLLMLMDILHGISGHTLYLPTQSLFVSEACSGVRSLVTLGAFSSIWSLFMNRGWIHGILLVTLSLGWVLVLNAMRIVVITWAATHNIDLLNGWPHTAIGLVMFALGVGLIGSTDALLSLIRSVVRTLLPERKRNLGVLASGEITNPTVWPNSNDAGWGSVRVAALFGALALQLVAAGMVLFHDRVPWQAGTHLPLLEGVMPEQIAGWKNELGPKQQQSQGMLALDVVSQQWVFTKGPIKAIVSMDDHFPGWHPLMDCYDFSGWKRLAVWAEDPPTGKRHIAVYQKSLDENGFLVFGLLNQHGEWIGRPEFLLRYWYTFVNHMKGVWLGSDIGGTEALTRQVQVFVESPFPLNNAAREDVMRLFEGARQVLEPRLWPEGK